LAVQDRSFARTQHTMAYTSPPLGCFDVNLTFEGRTAIIPSVTNQTTASELLEKAASALDLSNASVKLLHKGKVLGMDGPDSLAFPKGAKGNKVKVLVMATNRQDVTSLNSMRSDPLMRGLDDETASGQRRADRRSYWGPAHSEQHRHYKFVRLEACTWQSFGHRASSGVPHAFRAYEMLERLATDPGIVAVMTERELVVNTLGEMDPVDDRLLQKKKTEEGLCLLGYNTNHGLRIDVKLRTDDLAGFLPYEDVAATLLHELSHNWVGEHNALFWTNFGQMRAEYLHKHASLAALGYYVDGRTTAAIAGVADLCRGGMKTVAESVLGGISREASTHGVPVQMVAPAVLQRCEELMVKSGGSEKGQKVGSDDGGSAGTGNSGVRASARDLALAAAERRARAEQERTEEREKSKK